MFDNKKKNSITNQIRETLLKATEKDGVDLLRNAVEQLQKTLGSVECSLWYVNTNNHKHGELVNNSGYNTTSLICRKVSDQIGYKFCKPTDFVHTLDEGLFCQVMAICNKRDETNPIEYVRCNRKKVEEYDYLSLDFLKYLDEKGISPNDFIVIPIVSQINEESIIAILEFCFTSASYSENQWAEMAQIILSFFSFAFNRYAIISKQKLMADLVSTYRERKKYSMLELFKNTIDVLLDNNYYPCEVASFFIWDTYEFRYTLMYTTCAIDDEARKNIFYQLGDGIVGQVAVNNRAEIIDVITPIHKDNNSLFLEGVDNPKTAIVIPIPRISSDGDVVGILQLVNKINSNGPENLIDYFSELDLEIIQSIETYLALTIECFIKEEEQRIFIDKLSHELMIPARSIRNDADRIIRKRDDKIFNSFQLYSYMEDIINLSETQLWQVNTNLFQTRNPLKRKSKYKIEKAVLSTIIKKGKDAVKPIAREYGVRFDAIVYTDHRTLIMVDEEAFVTVFYNLFTNAIKYHDNTRPFSVRVFYRIMGNGIKIDIEDDGVGIDEREKDNIFHMGYRGANVIRFNADGFGVGLTTVKQIIEDFGGTIIVTNLKQPTRFTINLPINIIYNEQNNLG